MNNAIRHGAVIFTGNKNRLARFYEEVTGLRVQMNDASVTVLASDEFELVIHSLAGEPAAARASPEREAYVKPVFPVKSLAQTRNQIVTLGGQVRPPEEGWETRGFRACEAVDPDGNPIQFREVAP